MSEGTHAVTDDEIRSILERSRTVAVVGLSSNPARDSYDVARFLQVTAVFLFVFVVQLLIYGFHELTEAGIFAHSEALHLATEPYGPDGIYGQYLSYMLVVLPLGWLTISSLRGAGPSTK